MHISSISSTCIRPGTRIHISIYPKVVFGRCSYVIAMLPPLDVRDRANPPDGRRAPAPSPSGRPRPPGARIPPRQPMPAPPSPSVPSSPPPSPPAAPACRCARGLHRARARSACPRWSRWSRSFLRMIVELLRVVGHLHRPHPACPASSYRRTYATRGVW